MSEKVFILNPPYNLMSLKVNRNFALLYGIMLGDGCLSLVYGKKKFVAIAGCIYDDIPFFEKVVKPSIKKLIGKDISTKFIPSRGSIQLNFIKNSLFDFIRSFGFPVGKKGNLLFIPKIFYEKRLIKYVLRGYFATDGSLVITDNNGTIYPRVEANGICKFLLNEINNILNYKGINCKLYLAKRKPGKVWGYTHNHPVYRLQMNGKDNLKKFTREIGFINPKQIERLNKYYMAVEGVKPSVSAL